MRLASFNRMRRELAEKEAEQKTKKVEKKEPPKKKAEPKKSGE